MIYFLRCLRKNFQSSNCYFIILGSAQYEINIIPNTHLYKLYMYINMCNIYYVYTIIIDYYDKYIICY